MPCLIPVSLRSKRFRLLLYVLVLVNGARRTFSTKAGVRAKSERRGEGRGKVSFSSPPLPTPFHFFACPNLRAAKKRKRHSHVRKILSTYSMETLATQATFQFTFVPTADICKQQYAGCSIFPNSSDHST